MVENERPGEGYLSVGEAASYLGVSVQTLRRWDASGKLRPVRHPASGYRFYKRGDLEPFRIEYAVAETSTQPAEQLTEREQWRKEHAEYCLTPKWRAKRRLVFQRAKGICEGCGQSTADDCHHLSYKHWKDEFLFELVALCRPCHERWHESVAQ